MSTTNDLTQAAKNDFLDRNRDLLALTKKGPNDVFKRISASLALNTDAQANVMFYANPEVLEQKGYPGEVARARGVSPMSRRSRARKRARKKRECALRPKAKPIAAKIPWRGLIASPELPTSRAFAEALAEKTQ